VLLRLGVLADGRQIDALSPQEDISATAAAASRTFKVSQQSWMWSVCKHAPRNAAEVIANR
jgi:hypothetical protein